MTNVFESVGVVALTVALELIRGRCGAQSDRCRCPVGGAVPMLTCMVGWVWLTDGLGRTRRASSTNGRRTANSRKSHDR